MAIRNRLSELQNEISEWRKDIHAHPELLYDTFRTSELVRAKLEEFGCNEVTTGIGRTGVVGIIEGRRNDSGMTIGLRADMDALPIHEDSKVPHSSRNPGVMHACGHDGHTAMLLGAAKYLCQHRNFNGRIAVIFQPAEEGGAGGEAMVKNGMMEQFSIAEVYGMHNMPGLPTGHFAIKPGPFFAAADTFTIEAVGRGGHAAKPNDGVDPVLMASHIVTAMQSIVSRNNDPMDELVVSITSFETSSTTFNVIPQKATLKGTVRAMKETTKKMAEKKIRMISEGIANSFGGSAKVNYREGYPVMINAETETQYAIEAAKRVTDNVNGNASALMGAEDFAYMLNARPGAYILVGNGDTAPVHHPEYDFNDEVIPAGCSWWIELAEQRLPLG
ncbi:MAG: M20 family metallopeptidase [Rhodobacteraceae bacterium]|nr:M20 family metallopeptidase [Paracoccaceae bacterium]